ncbi:MAG TPA: hypothetical protein VGN54_05555 [Mycobacteriales bacterium]|nr:hypothetical protein [Mycobacteriales bacterium]
MDVQAMRGRARALPRTHPRANIAAMSVFGAAAGILIAAPGGDNIELFAAGMGFMFGFGTWAASRPVGEAEPTEGGPTGHATDRTSGEPGDVDGLVDGSGRAQGWPREG